MAEYTEYTEYERKLSGDPMGEYKIVWANIGKIKINENLIESEKDVSIDIDGEPKVIKAVTLASGTLHYIKKEEPNEKVLNCYENRINRRWGIIKKDGEIEKSCCYDCEKLYQRYHNNWKALETIIWSYIEDKRSLGKFVGTVKILFSEDFEYVTITGNTEYYCKGDSISITLKCKECVIK